MTCTSTQHDKEGLPKDIIEVSNRGVRGLATFIQDQTSPALTVPFLQERATVTLGADTVVNSRDIELVAGHGAVVGEIIELAEIGTNNFIQADVLGVNANGTTVSLDQPLNRIYTVGNSVALRSIKNMLVDGSTVPQVFSILPLPSQAGDMVRIIIEIRGEPGKALDYTTFGSANELDVGCVLRINHGDGTYTNKFNFKSNSDFFEQGFDHSFSDAKASGNTINGFTARVTWGGQSKHGVVIRVDGSLGEALELVIQDDLTTATTGNTRFHLNAQGHELQE